MTLLKATVVGRKLLNAKFSKYITKMDQELYCNWLGIFYFVESEDLWSEVTCETWKEDFAKKKKKKKMIVFLKWEHEVNELNWTHLRPMFPFYVVEYSTTSEFPWKIQCSFSLFWYDFVSCRKDKIFGWLAAVEKLQLITF